jgi:hypothetical protein
MEQDLPYKLGTIKLTWIDPNDYSILESKMFDSVSEALQNIPTEVKDNEYMIFKLTKTDGVAYEWKLLPYGIYKKFVKGMEFRNNKILYYGSIALAILGGVYVFKLIFSKK